MCMCKEFEVCVSTCALTEWCLMHALIESEAIHAHCLEQYTHYDQHEEQIHERKIFVFL
jgi:hypothetical protein